MDEEAQRLAEACAVRDPAEQFHANGGTGCAGVEHLKVQRNKKAKAARSTDKDAIAALRASVCAFDGDYEANNSITQEYVRAAVALMAPPVVGRQKVLFGEAGQTSLII